MNIPMFWITLDLVELYYSGLYLRHIKMARLRAILIWRSKGLDENP